MRETLRESLSGLRPRTGDIAFISAVTGAELDTSSLDGDYWFANLRQPVLFEQAVRWAYEHGYRTFIESSPHPVLTVGIQESLEEYGDDHCVVATLRRNDGGMDRVLLSAAEAHVHGKSPNWVTMFDGAGPRRIDLPTYAFDRKRYWLDPAPGFVDVSSLGVTAAEHPLLGAVVAQADSDEIILTGRLSLKSHPWLADHKVHGIVLVPATAMVEMALHAGDRARCPRVDELILHTPLIVGEHGGVAVQVVVGAWTRFRRTYGPDLLEDRRWCGPGVDTPCRRRAIPHRHAHRHSGYRTMAAGRRGTHRCLRAVPDAGRAWIRLRSGIPRSALGVAPWHRGVRGGRVARIR